MAAAIPNSTLEPSDSNLIIALESDLGGDEFDLDLRIVAESDCDDEENCQTEDGCSSTCPSACNSA